MASGGSALADFTGFAVEMKTDCPHVQVLFFVCVLKKLHCTIHEKHRTSFLLVSASPYAYLYAIFCCDLS